MTPAAEPWILICIACAGFSLFGAWLCRKAVNSCVATLKADQELFGPKRSLALERMKAMIEWGHNHARIQRLIDDIKSGKGLWEDPAMRQLAQEVHEASMKKDAELAAMTPAQREKAIRDWADKLAGEVGDLND